MYIQISTTQKNNDVVMTYKNKKKLKTWKRKYKKEEPNINYYKHTETNNKRRWHNIHLYLYELFLLFVCNILEG